MKKLITLTLLTLSLSSFAAPKTYQVTGPIVEMTDSTVTVMKGKDKWEILKDASTKLTGELKVGAKVTIEYVMTAKSMDVKAEKTKK